MKYIYIDNFRGFSSTVIPLRQGNFLVGENSTGKSSFLSLLSLMNDPKFWINPVFSMGEDKENSSFADIVSAWSNNKKSFFVGVVTIKKERLDKLKLLFHVYEFVSEDDSPVLSKIIKLKDSQLTSIFYDGKLTKYNVTAFEDIYVDENTAIQSFLKTINELSGQKAEWKNFPKGYPARVPLAIATSMIQLLEKHNDAGANFDIDIPMGMPVTWIAPIRTKPKRMYEGTKTPYSPEGEHTPLLLKKTLNSKKSLSTKIATKLAEFGELSGLFETITTHSYGAGTKNPFELLVKFEGAQINIKNVGYGVSQVLPLIVEFLTADRKKIFAVQQPEVHLHPKAQASLGALIFELMNEKKHVFFIETHSDYLIDRYRMSMSQSDTHSETQMLFFERTPAGNTVYALPISDTGQYPESQPSEFRSFFLKEELMLLGI